jgi:hypothetical protein
MSGSADRQSPADILIEGLGKIEDAHKIKVAFPYLPEPAVSILLRGLQAEGIKDVDAWLSQQAGCRDAAIRRLLAEGVIPPTNIPWKQFCDRVRDECNGWMGEGPARTAAWGFNDRTIKDTVGRVKHIVASVC